jgi:BCD family chlorophyll transporter-like MFS transporter
MSKSAPLGARVWQKLGTRFLPFADVATPELPLGRLLRLSMFQLSVGMVQTLFVGTLNRVMILELRVPASLVAIMLAIPLLAAPFRALVGFKSDTHRSILGWRRVPFLWGGTMVQFAGLSIMPFALLVLSDGPRVGPSWIGHAGTALAFLLVGAGAHTTQTAGLALATDLADEDKRPRVIALMYLTMLLGTLVSALVLEGVLRDFSAMRLIQVIQGTAVFTIVVNVVCPNVIYPYLRANVADVIQRAGFPPIHLAEINFEALYQQKMAQQQAEAQGANPSLIVPGRFN